MTKINWRQVIIFDNQGETVDRFTVCCKDGDLVHIYTMSETPTNRWYGVNQYSHSISRRNFKDWLKTFCKSNGKRIKPNDLPAEVIGAIVERLK